MKKTIDSKKLRLDTQTVRSLDAQELANAAGALAPKTVRSFCNYCFSLGGEGCTAPTAMC